MYRFRAAILAGFLACYAGGCGDESQPNAPTPPEAVNEDFTKKTADMMKSANSGMDPKNLKKASGTPAK